MKRIRKDRSLTSAEKGQRWREKHPEAPAAATRRWRKRNPEKARESSRLSAKLWRKAHPSLEKERKRYYYHSLRMEVFNGYGGPVCLCCGETEYDFLTLEHSKRDGAKQRKKFSGDPTGRHGNQMKLFLWLRNNNYPDNLGLEVLCSNCQRGRWHNTGACPHEGGT